ncbi:MAG: DUF2867 domain-containing protein [Gemmatimonadota bacterium]
MPPATSGVASSSPSRRSRPSSLVRQTAVFDPVGLAGLAYWYALYPIQALIFRGMFRRILEVMDERAA